MAQTESYYFRLPAKVKLSLRSMARKENMDMQALIIKMIEFYRSEFYDKDKVKP